MMVRPLLARVGQVPQAWMMPAGSSTRVHQVLGGDQGGVAEHRSSRSVRHAVAQDRV